MNQDLRTILQNIIPDHLHPLLVGSYDVVGDIAMIIIPDSCLAWQKQIGEAILASKPKIKVVAKRAGNYSGEFRLIPLEVIAGEKRTTTELRESGVSLLLDLAKVYYSGRSGSERLRIANCVKRGERVLVPFSGIAPYPLVIGARSMAKEVVGVEKNRDAHHYALCNRQKNRRIKNLSLYCADIKEWLCEERGDYQRVIMPLPKGGRGFVSDLLSVLSPGGWLHFYEMQQVDHFEESVDFLKQIAKENGRKVMACRVVKAGHCGPKTYRICVDIQLE